MRIVIVGNGVAGMEAALQLASRQEGHELTIVSEESDHFFSRTALMWIHCGQLSHSDVRSYAQRNQSFTRAACVGCGACAHVCPRGVLRLENSWKRHDDKLRQRLRVVDF